MNLWTFDSHETYSYKKNTNPRYRQIARTYNRKRARPKGDREEEERHTFCSLADW
jgi:hypothetical protein